MSFRKSCSGSRSIASVGSILISRRCPERSRLRSCSRRLFAEHEPVVVGLVGRECGPVVATPVGEEPTEKCRPVELITVGAGALRHPGPLRELRQDRPATVELTVSP